MKVKIGQIVWDPRYGYGIVKDVEPELIYSIYVEYEVEYPDGKHPVIISYTDEGIDNLDNMQTRFLFLECKRNYYSERDEQLVFVGKPLNKPIITIENYTKWYNLYLVGIDGVVSKITDDIPDWIDHSPVPTSIYKYAVEKDYYVDEQSMEMIIGRIVGDELLNSITDENVLDKILINDSDNMCSYRGDRKNMSISHG